MMQGTRQSCKQYSIYLEEDGDNLILPLPDDLLADAGWAAGDVIVWDIRPDGTILLTKRERWYKKAWNKLNSWRM